MKELTEKASLQSVYRIFAMTKPVTSVRSENPPGLRQHELTILRPPVRAAHHSPTPVPHRRLWLGVSTDVISRVVVRRMISNNPAVTRDFGFRIEAGDKFGLGFQINPIAYPKGRAANSMAWAGLWNTFFWIDPKSNICAVILMQSAPFVEEPAIQTLQAFEAAVYSNKPAGR
jgi:CubicO group peptidase (beta-lactamase class C family)